MRANAKIVIAGKKAVLVPYEAEHVPKYHEWMTNEELRILTASEPLTLEEEYEMQRKWREDEDKLTFIILAQMHDNPSHEIEFWDPNDSRLDSLPMIGDINMFLKGTPPVVGEVDTQMMDDDDPFEAEVEIMIAEQAYRRRGCASESLRLMLSYATHRPDLWSITTRTKNPESTDHNGSVESSWATSLPEPPLPIYPETLVARVSEKNTPSIALLEGLGFVIVKTVSVFEEVEMRWVGLPSSSR